MASSSYRLKISQKPNHPEDDTIFDSVCPSFFIESRRLEFEKRVILPVDESAKEVSFQLPAAPDLITVNPSGEVLAKVEPVNRDESLLALQALDDPEPLARVWADYALLEGLTEGKGISSSAETTLLLSLRQDPSPYVRNALLEGFQRMKARWLPENLAEGVFASSKAVMEGQGLDPKLLSSDPHGWTEYRAHLLGALGKVEKKETLGFLTAVFRRPDLPLDD